MLETTQNPSFLPIAVMTGQSRHAREMVQIYVNAFGRSNLFIIEEAGSLLGRLQKFLRARIRNRGVFSALDAILLRGLMQLQNGATSLAPCAPDLVVRHVNDKAVAELVRNKNARTMILSICSLLSAEQIKRIGIPIINVHNGITPRYRGAGNIWALAEDNPGMVGVTVHEVNAGVDTGTRLAVAYFDPIAATIPFSEIDTEAFRQGAKLAVDYLHSQKRVIPSRATGLIDRYYPFPGLSDWLRARKKFRRRKNRRGGSVERVWQDSFIARASDPMLSVPEKLHWSDGSTIKARNATVIEMAKKNLTAGGLVLDLGCGDAALAQEFGTCYVGCDYSESTLKLGSAETLRVAASATELPFQSESFNVSLGIGLLQHVQEAQTVADELLRVTRSGGAIVLNTLRQFSYLELMTIAMGSLFAPQRLALVAAIWRRQHGIIRGGTIVARRYTLRELLRLFPRGTRIISRNYHGTGGFIPFSREITVHFQLPKRHFSNHLSQHGISIADDVRSSR